VGQPAAGRAWPSGSGVGVVGCGVNGDLVAEAFQAPYVVAGLAAGLYALFVVAGAQILVLHTLGRAGRAPVTVAAF
jgi:hypothetical protein